jgi:AraC-like DNA-binding protein
LEKTLQILGDFMKSYSEYNSNKPLSFYTSISDVCEVDIHIHDTYEIYQALSQNIRYFVEGEAYDLNEGDVMITSSREIHRPITVDEKPYARRFIQFDPAMIHTFPDIDYNPLHIFDNRKLGQSNHIVVPSQARSIVETYFATIEAAHISTSPRNHYEAWLALQSFLVELEILFEASHSTHDQTQVIDPRIYNVRKYLDQHYSEAFNLDDLSKHYLIDKYHLSRLFKESTGFTLLEYIQSKRIRYAKTLLLGDQTILEISQQCGYGDYTNFFKTFKKLAKMSPKHYRATLSG